jgi:hydroxylamine dehydrogenase
MKFSFGKIGIVCVALLLVGLVTGAWAQSQNLNLAAKELVIKRGFTKEALSCIECHGKKMPGIMEG